MNCRNHILQFEDEIYHAEMLCFLLLWGLFLVIEFVSSASLLVVEYHLGMYSGDRVVYVEDPGNEVEWEVVCL